MVTFTRGEEDPTIQIQAEVSEIMACWVLHAEEPEAVRLKELMGSNKAMVLELLPRLQREQNNHYEDSQANSKNSNKFSRKNNRTDQ